LIIKNSIKKEKYNLGERENRHERRKGGKIRRREKRER